MARVFVSDALGAQRLAFGTTVPKAYPEAQRWSRLSALYEASLVACGFTVERVLRPEIYQTDVARAVRGVAGGDWHIAIKPIEHFRPFWGIPNVLVCDWPYPELSTSSHGVSPFLDQLRMLRQADIVACCTEFTAQSLKRAGVERVITLAPHVPPPQRTADTPRHRLPYGTTFLSVIDVDRLPRQLPPILEGFRLARLQRGDLHLIVRVAGAREQPTGIRGEVGPLSMVIDSANDAGLGDLLAAADFFLCGSAAEGLPLPVVQAMLAEVPVVTTMSSGMGAVVPPGYVVPIATTGAVADQADERLAGCMPLTCNPATAEAICDAVLAAVRLDGATCAEMTTTCRATAIRQFGIPAFQAALQRIGEAIQRQVPGTLPTAHRWS